MAEKFSIVEQLEFLKGTTAVTGIVHEAQVLQLKTWGLFIFEHVPSTRWHCEVGVDDKVVLYYLLGGAEPPSNYEDLLGGLERSVKFLFGDHWHLEVLQDNQFIYKDGKMLCQTKTK